MEQTFSFKLKSMAEELNLKPLYKSTDYDEKLLTNAEVHPSKPSA